MHFFSLHHIVLQLHQQQPTQPLTIITPPITSPTTSQMFTIIILLHGDIAGEGDKHCYCVSFYRYCHRSADHEARERRAAKLLEIGDIDTIAVNRISDVAANVTIAYDEKIWQNDMVFKDQDDCSKRLVCELNAMRSDGQLLTEHEEVLADAFGNGGELDIGKDSLEFDMAAVLGKEVGRHKTFLVNIFFC